MSPRVGFICDDCGLTWPSKDRHVEVKASDDEIELCPDCYEEDDDDDEEPKQAIKKARKKKRKKNRGRGRGFAGGYSGGHVR